MKNSKFQVKIQNYRLGARSLLCLVAIFLFSASFFTVPIFAAEAGEDQEELKILNAEKSKSQDKIKQLEETIKKTEKQISQKQSEGNLLKNQIAITDSEIAQIELKIQLTEENIKNTELNISSLEIAIREKEDVIKRQRVVIAEIIQGLRANDQKNFLEIMLTNDNFADFYNQAKYLESVYVDLGRSVKTLRLAKEDLENKKIQADTKRKNYDDLKIELLNKKSDLDERRGFKAGLLSQTRLDERRYQTLVDSLRKQYQIVENEVRTYEDKIRKKLSAQNKLDTDDNDLVFSWPAPSHYITAYFHDQLYPFKQVFEHNAIDIRATQGTPVAAAAPGYIGRAHVCTVASCYAYVLIVHTGDLSTVYGHLSQITVSEDQHVNRGDIIGYSGATPGTVGAGPFVTGPHLHFEVRKNGIPVDPLGYLIQ